MVDRTRARLLATAIALIATFVLGECAVRLVSRSDADGNVTFRSRRLRPWRPPVERARETARAYLASDATCVVYDAELGWAPRPGGRCREDLYVYDAAGARTAAGSVQVASPGAARDRDGPGVQRRSFRAAIFGDSFTHADDVPFEDSWGHRLETRLRESGTDAAVRNFGVGGYGIDQAYLRWRRVGPSESPDVIVLGFQAENAKRNLNLVRPLYYWRTGLPFTKPRFVPDGEGLRLVNVPAVSPEALPDLLADLDAWPLRAYERFYDPNDYRPRPWSWSRLVTLVVDVLADRRARATPPAATWYDADTEGGIVTRRLLAAFEESATAAGARFLVVHLPKREDLIRLEEGEARLDYADLWDELRERHDVVDPTDALRARGREVGWDALFVSPTNGHYSAEGNRVVAAVLADALASRVDAHAPPPLRDARTPRPPGRSPPDPSPPDAKDAPPPPPGSPRAGSSRRSPRRRRGG